MKTVSVLALGSLIVSAVVAAACSSNGTASGFGTRPPGTDPAGDEDGGPIFGDNSDASVNTCKKDPSKYDIPGNGCDDDGDGTIDNAPSCDASLAVTGNATEFARAMGICQASEGGKWGIVSAEYTRGFGVNTAPSDKQHGILPKFGAVITPREGAALGVLSSGFAREYNGDTGTKRFNETAAIGTGPGTLPPGFPKATSGCDVATNVNDTINVKLKLVVPSNAKGLTFDFNFFSSEWPSWVCSRFNDGFLAYLTSSKSAGGATNISFDGMNNPVSVNNNFFDRCTPNATTGCSSFLGSPGAAVCAGGEAELVGTGFGTKGTYCGKSTTSGGATGWLQTKAPVEPGETITLEFMVWDTGDSILDSSVLLDAFKWVPSDTETGTVRPPS
jgi:hypothetical protein